MLSAKKLAGTLLGGGGTKIVSSTIAVSVIPFEVPVTVTFTVPSAAPPVAVNVKVLVLVVLAGLKDAVTPLGRLDAVRFTLPEKPLCAVTVIVLAPLASC